MDNVRTLKIPVNPGSKPEDLLHKEWLVTNGLGGYASSSILGVNTRRDHGLLVPYLCQPWGRSVIVSNAIEHLHCGDSGALLTGYQHEREGITSQAADVCDAFMVTDQMPVWTFRVGHFVLRKQIVLVHGRNAVCVRYELLKGGQAVLTCRPFITLRTHENIFSSEELSLATTYDATGQGVEFPLHPHLTLRAVVWPDKLHYRKDVLNLDKIIYQVDRDRGYEASDRIGSPGYFTLELKEGIPLYLSFGIEDADFMVSLNEDAFSQQSSRIDRLLTSTEMAADGFSERLVMAADQFVIEPRPHNMGGPLPDKWRKRFSVIAGYHWFMDWGRDTMISLEGLTLVTRRYDVAREILRNFSRFINNGLMFNAFTDTGTAPSYNTVDATLWYFHAIDRYVAYSRDLNFLKELYPLMESIMGAHLEGVTPHICVDPADRLLRASAPHAPMTWMDAQVESYVVTPRRGKPVEIQALWYNALRLMEEWGLRLGFGVDHWRQLGDEVKKSFNNRFWSPTQGCLYDVIDGPPAVCDFSIRPNQILAMSLEHPVLNEVYWKPVMDTVTRKLLTPYGLRTLSADDSFYHPYYQGNLLSRDEAYHQGSVWPWLIGPYVDAALRAGVDKRRLRDYLLRFEPHFLEAGVGSISEIFDGDSPHSPRGCIAQAWSVAEVLRVYLKTTESGVPV